MRRAWRSAQRLGAELDVLWVQPPGGAPSDERARGSPRCASSRSVLGAHLLVRESDDVVEAVARRRSAERGTTYVLLGESPPPRGLGAAARAAAAAADARRAGGVDVRIVADRARETGAAR